jgi:hypothetical protein
MIKLNKEAEARQQKMLELEQEQELLTSQLEYARMKNQKMMEEKTNKEQRMNQLSQKNQ